jgi:antibiotic biosynthesis monooxygenase (ABM) superfamily enzyme
MTVDELRKILADLPGHLPVCVEVSFQEGDEHEVADLQTVDVETRCDDIETLYLWGDQDERQYARGEEEAPVSG